MAQHAIICVDDEPVVLDGLSSQLDREFGREYLIEMAQSGEEALELFEEFREQEVEVPVLISDQIMPGMKGSELMYLVSDLSAETLKILLTGQAAADEVGDAVNRGGLYRYIAKPWDSTDLILTVQEAIKSYRQARELEIKNRQLQEYAEQLEEKVRIRTRELQEEMERSERLLEKIRTLFGQHVSREVASELIARPEDGATSKACEVTVMFLDIRDFTVFADSREPREVERFQNLVFDQLINITRAHRGIVNQILGDGIMAIFGAPVASLTHAADAVAAGYRMIEKIEGLSEEGKIPPIGVGIGLHTGKVVAGELGNEYRKYYSLTGSNVIIAARLEQLNKELKTRFLVSSAVYEQIRHLGYPVVSHGARSLRGISNAVGVYELA